MEVDLSITLPQGWIVGQVIGDGNFADVRVLVNVETQQHLVAKFFHVNHLDEDSARKYVADIKREALLMKFIAKKAHPNVVQFIRHDLYDGGVQAIMMEYVSGGELFDRIEPDLGMPESSAQFYFRQLISGLEFLHQCGVAHLDIKPENLLLTENDVLKIIDFGFATLFVDSKTGQPRPISERRGTVPYCAPEVFVSSKENRYYPNIADIWSSGVVLTGMLSGHLPWSEATLVDSEFVNWRQNDYINSLPFGSIDATPLSLLRRILAANPKKRANLEEIKEHRWMTKSLRKKKNLVRSVVKSSELTRTDSEDGAMSQSQGTCGRLDLLRVPKTAHSHSQPSTSIPLERDCDSPEQISPLPGSGDCWSQPADPRSRFLTSQCDTQPSSQLSQGSALQLMVKKMTRFFVGASYDEVMTLISEACFSLGCTNVRRVYNEVKMSTFDSRGSALALCATVIPRRQLNLIDFRLSTGDGLEFKRFFLKLKALLACIIVPNPDDWNPRQPAVMTSLVARSDSTSSQTSQVGETMDTT